MNNRKSRQVILLYSGTAIQLVLGLIASVILARMLKPDQYGQYCFIITLIYLTLTVVSIGHFVTISMILAQSENETDKRCFLGASLLLSILVSCMFSSILFSYSFFHDYLFDDKLGRGIRLLAIPLIFFPIQQYLENVFMGLNHIAALTVLRVLPKALYIIILLLFIQVRNLTYSGAVVLMLLTSYVVYVNQVLMLKPKFSNLSSSINRIERENRKYGFHVYLGSLANVATSYLCTLSIGYFSSNTQLGFFNVALITSVPLSLLPNIIATIYYKNFAVMVRIPKKLIQYTILFCGLSYIVFILCVEFVITFLYSNEYSESIKLAYILGFGAIAHGLGDLFNRFLCAKARGKAVRNGAFIVGGFNVLLVLLLVPVFGSTGAAMTRLVVGVIYFGSMYFYYRHECAIIATDNKGNVNEPK